MNPAVQQIANAVSAIQHGQNNLEIRLDPPELGRVYIDFIFDGERAIAATVSAEQQDTAALLRRNAEILMKELSEAGFEGIDLTFTDAKEERTQQSQIEEIFIAIEETTTIPDQTGVTPIKGLINGTQNLDLRV